MIFKLIIMWMLALSNPNVPDDHLIFNCHFHGNQECGPGTPGHGFVNIDQWRL